MTYIYFAWLLNLHSFGFEGPQTIGCGAFKVWLKAVSTEKNDCNSWRDIDGVF